MAKYYRITSDKNELCAIAADYWMECYRSTLDTAPLFHVALSGGSTPKSLYQLLATDKYSDQIDWQKVHLYFGDERCVPLDHPDSNFLMAKTALIDHVDIPPQNVHPVKIVENDPARCAAEYQRQLADVMVCESNAIPRFDLVLLGMGEDGHTASLFPGTPILQQRERWVSEVYVSHLDSWRVSLTYPIINNAHKILVLVSGANKADKISEILTAPVTEPKYPIQGIVPKGDILWLVDKAAAAALNNENVSVDMTKVA